MRRNCWAVPVGIIVLTAVLAGAAFAQEERDPEAVILKTMLARFEDNDRIRVLRAGHPPCEGRYRSHDRSTLNVETDNGDHGLPVESVNELWQGKSRFWPGVGKGALYGGGGCAVIGGTIGLLYGTRTNDEEWLYTLVGVVWGLMGGGLLGSITGGIIGANSPEWEQL